MKHALLIDSSIVGASMAVGRWDLTGDPHITGERHSLGNRGASARLDSMYRELRAEKLLPQIDGLVITHGPGSFTGIKVGLAYAHGLIRGMPERPPVLTISILEELERKYREQRKSVLLKSTADAGFLAVADGAHCKVSVLRLANDGTELAKKDVVLLRPWQEAEEMLSAAGRSFVVLNEESLFRESKQAMLAACVRGWPDEFTNELPQPNYLRASRAEERLQPNMQKH